MNRIVVLVIAVLLTCCSFSLCVAGIADWQVCNAAANSKEDAALREIENLLDAGGNVNAKCGTNTPLITAAGRGYARVVQLLLERGADPNIRGSQGHTALWLAIQVGCGRFDPGSYLSTIKILLEAGADANARDDDGKTPLQVAVGPCGSSKLADIVSSYARRRK